MNKQKLILFAAVLVMMGGTAGVLAHLKTNQRLGEPGVKTATLPDSSNLEVLLPADVPGYVSEKLDQPEVVVNFLPKDTSYGQRRYTAEDGFWVQANVVLMGTDRTSIHKPQFCLTGQGWQIDASASANETIRVERPHPYDLPVVKLVSTGNFTVNGRQQTFRSVYVYWFVADNIITADGSGLERMWRTALELFRTGELQRWAYVTYFAVCLPGQEDQTFERMKKLIVASVPEFQLVPEAARETVSAAN